jgi:hypothetical protein
MKTAFLILNRYSGQFLVAPYREIHLDDFNYFLQTVKGFGTSCQRQWFKEVRILAIFDDLDTNLLMIPLQIMVVGCKPELFFYSGCRERPVVDGM